MKKNILFTLLSLLFFNSLVANNSSRNRCFIFDVDCSNERNSLKSVVFDGTSLPPLSLSLTYSVHNTSCSSSTDGSIVGYASGGTAPYTFTISGIVLPSNTNGVFSNLPSGTYSISVTDSALNTLSQNNITVENPVNPLVVSSNTSICSGSPTTLSVSGSANPFSWVALPADPTLTSPTSATPVVSPIINTNYTATSSVVTTKNLVYNGDFSSGNVGFGTDYQYLAVAPIVGAQKAYGIVSNPNTWFSPFSNCPDHTSGTGNMMVLDGSSSNGGNDKFWSQTIPTIAGQNYTFSYWVQTLTSSSPASIQVTINGVALGSLNFAPNVTTCGNWTEYTFIWSSGASTSAQIEMFDRNVSASGNDFAIDDISFSTNTTCSFTKTISITINSLEIAVPVNQVVCNGTSIPLLEFTSNQPGTTFSWTNSNTLLPIGSSGIGNITNLLANNNTSNPIVSNITVTGSLSGCTNDVKQFTITINPTPKIIVNSVQKCTGDLTPAVITATPAFPGTYSYAWTVPATVAPPGNVASIASTTVAGNYSVVITDTSTGCVSAPATGTLQYLINCCPSDIAIPFPETLCNNSSCTTLTATYVDVRNTNTYTVSSIPYVPAVPSGSSIGTPLCTIDDAFSDPQTLPFKFSFFGACYDKFQVGTNTFLTFNATRGPCSGSGINASGYVIPAGQTIPSTAMNALWRNSIYFPMQDTNPTVPSTPSVSITYIVDGLAPCRRAIINVKNMPLFSCGITQGLQESQLVLYEGTNIIDIYVKKRSVCTWNNGSGVIGIQNATATVAFTPPLRNTGTWTATDEAWRFTPAGPSLTTFQWLDSTGATVGTTPSISVCPNATTTYTAQVNYNNTCTPLLPVRTITKPVTVEVNPDDTLSPIDIVQCAPTNLFDLTSNEAIALANVTPEDYTVSYHTSLEDAQNIANPIVDIINYSIPSGSSQTIFMSMQSNNNICVRVKPFNLILNPIPPAPIVAPVTYCQNAVASDLTATGSSLLWYTAATGGTGSATAITPVTTLSGSTDYFVTQTVSGCESPRASITVKVNATPVAPTVAPVTYCQFTTPSALTATGSNLLWYTNSTGGVGSAIAPTPSTASTVSVTYYVSQTILGCEGPRASITVTINPAPLAPLVAPVTYCQNATASALTATGTSLLWYTTAIGGTGSATAPIPVTTPASSITHYVSQTLLGCESPRASITVTVNPTPAVPSVLTPVTYCQNDSSSALTATGTSLLWYTAAIGGTGSATAPIPLTTPPSSITHYVSQTLLGCEGSRASITVTVNPTPVAPTVAPLTYCQNAIAPALTAGGSNLLWY
ncbi:hypothetical protein, partial [Flavobacterium sp.]|uniref:Ig-like domain-containing protein n=1 Tax=Flavobacterium sp. TaxID=239 RepID=UPI003BD279EB